MFECTSLATVAATVAATATFSISGVVGWSIWELSHLVAMDLDGVSRSAVEDAAVAIPPELVCLAGGKSGVKVAAALRV